MANYETAQPGQPLKIPAGWFNSVTELLTKTDSKSTGGKPTTLAPVGYTLVKVGVAAAGDNLYQGEFLANPGVVIDSVAALAVTEFFASTTAVGDCVIADWPNVGNTDRALAGGEVLPAILSGWAELSGRLVPLFHPCGRSDESSPPFDPATDIGLGDAFEVYQTNAAGTANIFDAARGI